MSSEPLPSAGGKRSARCSVRRSRSGPCSSPRWRHPRCRRTVSGWDPWPVGRSYMRTRLQPHWRQAAEGASCEPPRRSDRFRKGQQLHLRRRKNQATPVPHRLSHVRAKLSRFRYKGALQLGSGLRPHQVPEPRILAQITPPPEDVSSALERMRRIGGDVLLQQRERRVAIAERSEEHTSELQSLAYLVCRLLLEKKNRYKNDERH